jgi:hypothetical protein
MIHSGELPGVSPLFLHHVVASKFGSTLPVQGLSKGKTKFSCDPLISVASLEQTVEACHLLSAHQGISQDQSLPSILRQ